MEPLRRKILVVDDHPTLARAIKRMLSDDDVTIVDTGRSALAIIERGDRYDVILCDLMMPEISGMELHRALVELAPDQVGKMIFMTGGAFTNKAREFFDKVANPTIEKPFDRTALLAVIDGLMQ